MTAIALVISDVDGTLVTPDKEVTAAARHAVWRLREAGIGFTVTSSRPPIGLRRLVEPLLLKLPLGAFNGGAIVGPDLKVMKEHLVPEPAARRSVDLLDECGADIWVFTSDEWLARNIDGDYVPLERKTIQTEPTRVADLGPHLARAGKIVGSSSDFARLADCEARMRARLGEQASVARSQPYYLDITAPGVDKGTFLEALATQLAVPAEAIAVLGDMENDLPMFRKAALSIAMGNASCNVKAQASRVTQSNEHDGFALAIEKYILQGRGGEAGERRSHQGSPSADRPRS